MSPARKISLLVSIALLAACHTEPPPRRVDVADCSTPPPRDCTDGVCSDVMFILDISQSTKAPWRDGRRSPTVLDASAAAVRALMDRTRANDQRVGLIVVSGGTADLRYWRNSVGTIQPAWVEVPLTPDRGCAAERVAQVARRQPFGMTHLAHAINLATIELRGFRGALSIDQRDRLHAVVIFTDGPPSLPNGGRGVGTDLLYAGVRGMPATEAAVQRAGRLKIPVLLAGIGRDADELRYLAPAVRETGGTVALAPGPRELRATVDRFAELLSD